MSHAQHAIGWTWLPTGSTAPQTLIWTVLAIEAAIPALLLVGVGIGLAGVLFVSDRDTRGVAPWIARAIWPIYGVAMLGWCAQHLGRAGRAPLRPVSGRLALVPRLAVIAGATPYLGLKTEWSFLKRHLARHPEAAATYRCAGRTVHIQQAGDEEAIASRPPWVLDKLLAFRPVDLAPAQRGLH